MLVSAAIYEEGWGQAEVGIRGTIAAAATIRSLVLAPVQRSPHFHLSCFWMLCLAAVSPLCSVFCYSATAREVQDRPDCARQCVAAEGCQGHTMVTCGFRVIGDSDRAVTCHTVKGAQPGPALVPPERQKGLDVAVGQW